MKDDWLSLDVACFVVAHVLEATYFMNNYFHSYC